MSDLLTSLSALFASNYPYVPRTNNVQGNPARANDQFARELVNGDLKPGTTVTQSTQYTVGTDGRLQKTGSQVTIGGQTATDTSLIPFAPFTTPAPTSLAALQRPRAQLTPEEEALLFDADSIEGGLDGQARRFFDEAGAQDENGDAVVVEILSPDVADRDLPTLASQQQQRVSNLYARNNDVVYNVEPAIAFAA